MSETQEKTSASPSDPFEPFRAVRDAYLDALAKTMVEAVNTETYAQASGTILEGYLSAVAPFREALDKSALQTLQHLELPSRQDVAALAERFTHVEMRLDDIDAKLDSIGKWLDQNGSTPGPTAETGTSAIPSANIHGSGGTRAAHPSRGGRPVMRRNPGGGQR